MKGTSGIPIQRSRTVESALSALSRYELDNGDLSGPTRRLLGLAAISGYYGRRLLEQALGQSLPKALRRDTSWRYWQVLSLAGLESYWGEFAQTAPVRGIWYSCQRLKARCGQAAYHQFLRRLGTNPQHSQRTHQNARQRTIWTKGGCWRQDSNWTRLLVSKEHLQRPYTKAWHFSLGEAKVRLLESELHHLIDPDRELLYDARQHALDYMRHRLPDMAGWKGYDGDWVMAWFFQERIPHKGRWIVPTPDGGYIRERLRNKEPWRW